MIFYYWELSSLVQVEILPEDEQFSYAYEVSCYIILFKHCCTKSSQPFIVIILFYSLLISYWCLTNACSSRHGLFEKFFNNINIMLELQYIAY